MTRSSPALIGYGPCSGWPFSNDLIVFQYDSCSACQSMILLRNFNVDPVIQDHFHDTSATKNGPLIVLAILEED